MSIKLVETATPVHYARTAGMVSETTIKDMF